MKDSILNIDLTIKKECAFFTAFQVQMTKFDESFIYSCCTLKEIQVLKKKSKNCSKVLCFIKLLEGLRKFLHFKKIL